MGEAYFLYIWVRLTSSLSNRYVLSLGNIRGRS
jgi:hypothetical protein